MTGEGEPILAGVELGGTKTIALLARGDLELDRCTVATTTPDETLDAIAARLSVWRRDAGPRALGIASFGPVAVRADASDYGHMLATPKPGWAGIDVLGRLAAALPGPVAIHTDVTAAALAEQRHGAGRGLSDIVYVTIGTGIGMGILVNGRPVVGQMHPEAGHLRVRRQSGDRFSGVCPFHGDCLEGLASGPAIAARAGRPATALAPDDPAWSLVADAIAEGLTALLLSLAPQRIILGGGIAVGQPHLVAMIRAAMRAKTGDYLPFARGAALDTLIVLAGLSADAGPKGTIELARLALDGDPISRQPPPSAS